MQKVPGLSPDGDKKVFNIRKKRKILNWKNKKRARRKKMNVGLKISTKNFFSEDFY